MDIPLVTARPSRAPGPDPLDADRASIHAAIDMVANGRARRMVLCGLRYAERLLPDAVAAGCSAGVVVRLDRTGAQPAVVIRTDRPGHRV